MKLTEINKSITAGATALAGMEGVVAFLNADTTHPWVHLVAIGASAVVSAATWWVKNEDKIGKTVAEIDHVAPPAETVAPESVPNVIVEAATQAATAAVQAAIPALAPAATAVVNSVLPEGVRPTAEAIETAGQAMVEAAIEQFKNTH